MQPQKHRFFIIFWHFFIKYFIKNNFYKNIFLKRKSIIVETKVDDNDHRCNFLKSFSRSLSLVSPTPVVIARRDPLLRAIQIKKWDRIYPLSRSNPPLNFDKTLPPSWGRHRLRWRPNSSPPPLKISPGKVTPSVPISAPISSPISSPKNDPKMAQKWLFQPVPLKWYETPKIPQKGQNRT